MNLLQNFLLKIIFVLFFSIIIEFNSQSLTVSYELISRPNPDEKDNLKTQNYVLDIFENKSIFRTEMRKESDSLLNKTGFGLQYYLDPNHEVYFTKDLNKHLFTKGFVSPMSRDHFFIKITDELVWKISAETALISNFNCQKAEVQYGGRNWTAWFTKDIPISEGPYYFHGLPGLIIQVKDNDGDYVFNALEIKKLKNKSLYEVQSGTEIAWSQYKKILQDFFDSPYNFAKAKGMKVVQDNGSGGTKEIDYRQRTRETQMMLLNKNNPIELNHKINFK